MKLFYRICALLLALVAALSLLTSCKERDENADTEEPETYSGMPEYDVENIAEYIEPFEYTGLNISVGETEYESEVVWNTMLRSANIIKYPTPQVEYYAEQERAKYRYYASRENIEYGTLLESLGVTEESIYETARGYIKDDLVLAYIVTDANISLTDDEKTRLTYKYAEKLTEVYGYDAEYIMENMTEQVYYAMLYDKTMEYLMANNIINVA